MILFKNDKQAEIDVEQVMLAALKKELAEYQPFVDALKRRIERIQESIESRKKQMDEENKKL